MAGSAPSDKVKNKEYSNWLKVTLALYYMKSGLHTFIQNEVDGLHQSLVQNIYGARTVPLPPCTICHACHVKRNKYNGVWTLSKQCKSYCDVWLDELLVLHSNPKSEKIYWDNSDVASWPCKSWECAKVFMPRGQPPSSVGPAECDAQAILTMLANCKHFHHRLSPQGLGLTHTVSSIRNKVMHDGEMKLSDADRSTFIQQIIQLLEDPMSLKSIEDCKVAVGKIIKINNDSLDVSFNLDNEMTGLRSAVNEFRLELGMQEKRTLDTVDSLKEEYKQLQEQITKRFVDIENKMDSIRRNIQSVKELTDNALQQQEKKHQELHTAVNSHGVRLDTIEENVPLLATELQEIRTNTESAIWQQERKHQEMHTIVTSQGVRLHTVEEHMQCFDSELQELKTNILTERENNSGWERKADGERTSKYNILEARPKNRRLETDALRQLKCQTEDKLDTVRRLGYILTTQAQAAKKLLDGKRSVVIKGNPGEGKTTTALHLIDNKMYTDKRVVVYCPNDWKAVDTDWVNVVVFEDILGKFDLDLARLQEWMVLLPNIQEHVDAGKLQVIITTRTDILSKVFSKFRSINLFSDDLSLTLSSEQLKSSEKMSILNRELYRHQKNMNENEKEKCISNFSGLIGFPQCCSLFAGDSNLIDRGPEFFKSPAKLFVENISKLEDTRFLSLAFLFCNGEIQEDYLSLETMPEPMKHLLMEVASRLHISERMASVTLLRDIYDGFLGLYIVKSVSHESRFRSFVAKSCIRFSHAVVCEAVGQVLGDRCVEIVVKYGDSEYLYQRTYTAESKDNTLQNVFIHVSIYGLLAERMVHDVIDKRLVQNVVKHTALRQHRFMMKLIDELHKGNRVREFLVDRYDFILRQDLSEGDCATFLQYILQSDKDVVTLVYSHFLEFLACTHSNKIADCWQCKEKQRLLELALYYHHFEIADKLIVMNACYTYISLCNSARHGDLRRVNTIIKALKRSQVFSPVCDKAKVALCKAYKSGNQKVIELFLKEGITLDSKHVVDVVRHGDMNALLKVTEHLKCHNNWNPHLEKYWTHMTELLSTEYPCQDQTHKVDHIPFSIALYTAYCKEEFDKADHLVQNGVILSMDMLLHVLISSSQKAVSRLIQTLKDTGTWDSSWCHASEALQIAYSTHKFDVCDLLIQLGFSLTMENLGFVNMDSEASFTSVKKAIQHLKESDIWDPKCHDASMALHYAYCKQKYDVCDLLIQEGVSLTMTYFYSMWTIPTFELVKNKIQHLKGCDNWDPKSDEASKALEYAYIKQKYDVCDLLIQEGVSLTMKNLHNVICNSFETVKKAIQHLKDTARWDPECDDASKALEYAYNKKMYDVCDLLLQEGVSVTMENLTLFTEKDNVSLEFVTKAIQYLKDSDNWDPKCEYASKALENAYSKQAYNVCDLFAQEGVFMPMVYFPGVIKATETLESVRKIIKTLKDSNNWDPKCDDASKTLREACSKQKSDICDVLIQEGVSLTMEHFLDVIRTTKMVKSVKKIIQNLKDLDNWDPKCDHALVALGVAYGQQKYDVCDLLIQEGVVLAMKNLPGLCGFHASFESLMKAVQHLKDTNSWDPTCGDASKALEDAYKAQAYEVCDLLVQEGVSLTMMNLSSLCEVCYPFAHPVSVQTVKKVIQNLKDTGSWDPGCEDASKALRKAYWNNDVWDLLIQEGVSLTMKYFHHLFYSTVTFDFVKKTIQHLQDTHLWDPKSDDAHQALREAYLKRNKDVFDLLVEEGVPLKMADLLGIIMQFKTFESVKKTIQHLKYSNSWDPNCHDASVALNVAYHERRYDVCALLIEERVSLTMKNLPGLCDYQASFQFVRRAVQYLKDTDNWDPECDDASKALENAFEKHSYDVCDLLIEEGVLLTMKNLPHLCGLLSSVESVKKAIRHLKDTDSWYSRCDDASKALKIVYKQEVYDVCDLLVEEGVLLTMKNFPGLCEFTVSVKSVKKSIQFLKDTHNWDPLCDDACEALKNAYIHEAHDICDLIVDGGVSLTMKNLLELCIFPISIQSLKKAIQHLKDTENWDPMCDDAYEALDNAYWEQNREVWEMLVEEQFLIPMMYFPRILKITKTFKAARKTIQNLKDTDNWDPDCDYACEALENAYSEQAFDVCDLLVKEGVSLTMTNLLGLCGFPSSVQSLKKAIQNLKDTGNWDPKCDDASKALNNAYTKHAFDVCDLLIEEHVPLTMMHLPGILTRSNTFEYAKNTIQLLKDTYRWDPECDDASKALEIAYKQEVYDVCDLLVEEGVLLTMRNFPGLCGFPVSIKSVKKSVQFFKDTNNWDPLCDDASEALESVFDQEVYDVCDLLVEEGIALKMKNFFRLLHFAVSAQSVKKVIQHLKDTDNWNPKCDYASEALEYVCDMQMDDLFDLLVEEGVAIQMMYLSDVISKGSESVKKIIHDLKNRDLWDPKCDYASVALGKAYYLQKFDVCDLLIQEGVTLTMKSLPDIIRTSKTLTSVRKAIQHLKDTDKWNSECEDASKALENSYYLLKYKVCDLLFEEGVSVTMKNLLGLCGLQASFQIVKKIIEHLKDTGNWDPMCDDASKALENVYIKQAYDVYDLLIEEGVSLTMKNLPGLCGFQTSVQSLKKAIQNLKDTNNWNPKCTNASQALINACNIHMYNVCYLLFEEGVSFTMKNLPDVCGFHASLKFVKKTLQNLKDANKWDPECDDAFQALENAYVEHKYIICDLLHEEGVSLAMKNLPHLCGFPASVQSFKKAIQNLKDNGIWDTKCDDASKAFQNAYYQHNYKVCDLLIEEGVSVTMKNLPGLCGLHASFQYVKKTIQNFKETGIWDPECDDAFQALENAYVEHKYNICDLLHEEGVSLAMKNLPHLCGFPVSVQSFKKAIQNLKSNGMWDTECNDAHKALEYAYIKHKYNVCDLLIEEGVSLTMKNLPAVCEFQASFQFVQKAIQNLKDTGNWDPKCDDASKALENAYIKNKYNVCDLLIEEGVSLTMKNLTAVCKYQESFHFIKKAIQNLKDHGNWDPKCDYASKALEYAYRKQKFDVCDLLCKEGVSLKMKNLPGLCGFDASFQFLKKAIKNLKDTGNWDLKCGDAFKALENAYQKHSYYVCDLLIEEGVLLTMENLPHLCGCQASFQFLKKAIQQLKDTENWDPRSVHAFKALENASCEQRYEVCDLLLQEGVSLTM